jgi:hypothetical protein
LRHEFIRPTASSHAANLDSKKSTRVPVSSKQIRHFGIVVGIGVGINVTVGAGVGCIVGYTVGHGVGRGVGI